MARTAYTAKNSYQLYQIFIFLLLVLAIGMSMPEGNMILCTLSTSLQDVMSGKAISQSIGGYGVYMECMGSALFVGLQYVGILAVVWVILGVIILTCGTGCIITKEFTTRKCKGKKKADLNDEKFHLQYVSSENSVIPPPSDLEHIKTIIN